jgi:hypothetical protein
MIPDQLVFNGSNKEFQFRDQFVMPLLVRLGFAVVVNYHGRREFGRDVIFGEVDRFGHFIYYGMQLKYESSVGLKDSHSLVQDAEQATHNPFRHPQTGREEYISCFYVLNAGDFSDEARDNFFNITARRGIRDARLLDGNSLVLLNQSISELAGDASKTPSEAPVVGLRLAMTKLPTGDYSSFLAITLLNKSNRNVFIGNFYLLLNDDLRLVFPIDTLTGEPQRKRKIEPGDSFAFHIEASDLKQFGKRETDYVCAGVDDAVGGSYFSGTEIVRECIADLLKERE